MKTNIDRYDNFLSELITMCKKKESFITSNLIQAHGVSYDCIASLMNLGHLKLVEGKKKGHRLFSFHHNGLSEDRIVDLMIKANSEFYKIRVAKKHKSDINVTSLIDNTTDIVELALKYNIEKDRMKEFIRDFLILKLKPVK